MEEEIRIPLGALTTLGVNAKLNRGREHMETFVREGRAFVERSPLAIEPWYSDDFREYEFRVRISEPPDVLRWSLLIGDALNNFRSALDHAVYAVAAHSTGSDPPPGWRNLQFALTDTLEAFKAECKQGRLRGVPGEAVDAIRVSQPFIPPSGSLGRLQELNNTDKHQLLHLVAGLPEETEVKITNAGQLTEAIINRDAPIQDGVLLARFVFADPCPNATFSPSTSVLYAFTDEPNPRRGASRELAEISTGVISAIEPLRRFMPALELGS